MMLTMPTQRLVVGTQSSLRLSNALGRESKIADQKLWEERHDV
jgi:hypothetical protein